MDMIERVPLSQKILEQDIKPRLMLGDMDGITKVLHAARIGAYRCHWNEALWFSLVGRMVKELIVHYDLRFEENWLRYWLKVIEDDDLREVTRRLELDRDDPSLADLFRASIDVGISIDRVLNTLDQAWLAYGTEGRTRTAN